MNCSRARKDLLRMVDGDLSVDRSLDVEAHVADCPKCADALATQRQLDEIVLSAPRPTLFATDRARLKAGIHRRIQDATESSNTRRQPRLVRPIGLVAAALALCLVGGWLAWRSTTPQTNTPSDAPFVAVPQVAPTPEHPIVDEPEGPHDVAMTSNPEGPSPIETTSPEDASNVDSLPLEGVFSEVAPTSVLPRVRFAALVGSVEESVLVSDSFLAMAREELGDDQTILNSLRRCALHEDFSIAHRSLRLIGTVAESGALGPMDRSMANTLTRAMENPDRARAAFETLLRIDSEIARPALCRALRSDLVRGVAMPSLANHTDPQIRSMWHRQAAKLLRSESPRDQALFAKSLSTFTLDNPSRLEVFADFYREGASHSQLSTILAEASDSVVRTLEDSVRHNSPYPRSFALRLISLAPRIEWMASLESLILRNLHNASCLEILASIEGVEPLQRLLQLADNPRLSRSQRRLLHTGFEIAVARRSPAELLAQVSTLPQESMHSFIERCAAIEGPLGLQCLLDLIDSPQVVQSTRSYASVWLAGVTTPPEPGSLLSLVSSEHERLRNDVNEDTRVLSSLLLSTYRIGGRADLREACRTLGLDDNTRRRLAHEVRVAARSPLSDLDACDRIASLLRP